MTKADEYRQLAAECVQIAQTLINHKDRLNLLTMAERWRELAERAERQETPNTDGK
jgi:hypothetical protein